MASKKEIVPQLFVNAIIQAEEPAVTMSNFLLGSALCYFEGTRLSHQIGLRWTCKATLAQNMPALVSVSYRAFVNYK